MFIKPQGPDLTAEQARALDDDFFTSRPFEFFASRIASLIESSERSAVDRASSLASGFAGVLGLDDAPEILNVDRCDRELQIALDSLAVRHHVAEALVRFYHAVSIGPRNRSAPNVVCTWASVCNGPIKTSDLVAETTDYLLSETGRATFWTLVVPAEADVDSLPAEGVMARVQLLADWLVHAMRLLVRDDIDINAAHNKLKHGLAVRSRDDLRVTFIQQAPEDGTVPLSALTSPDAIDLIDTISLDYLSRARPRNGRKQGMEVATLRLSPATLLAETWMMALTYGAMFHIAAARHFGARGDVKLARYPDMPTGPTPDQLLKESVIGIRRPLTTPLDGGPSDRAAGIAFYEGFVPVNIDHAAAQSAVVVDR
ncbi:hypothetical protein [Micromonospora sp. ATA51]|uniref:hypothetical protein n=1 Tax=Micromonospora sp. ATA51 TaxID=2806098 RepID=UPI001A3B7106|nr:hypothetical protein [Micromonospora sp. ATA51]MBM0227971.1 hypothetical protein [Micromonospora sp. ATA51]